MLQETFSILTTKGEELFLTIWKCFEFPNNWYISPLQFDLESDSFLTCMTKNYINLYVQSSLKKCDLKKDDLETFLNDDLFAELGRAYEEDLNNIEYLTSRKVKYYKSISYTIVDKDEQINVKLNVGDVVDVLEDITPLGNISQDATDMVTRVSYAQIKAIILHQKGQLQVPFLFLDWFISQNTNDQKLKCPLYKLQRQSDYTWRCIYAIKWIDHQPNPYNLD
ncbi:hypothetical protein RhiirA4_465992 [Rhizophagus irregularis]|uniref:Uncharacterized protein n=1 Tax=Rhizophagus irregularis TaxID=588596 RepID=A0A2I1GT79_9GLOM|nr:hypothetical protein RhiirA4_465992 [Rhizophagus irregularis]